MPRTPPQEYIGRKLCDGPCGRWRLDVDFKPRWKKFLRKPKGIKRDAHNKIVTVRVREPGRVKPIWVKGPYYDNLCFSCRTKRTIEQHQAKLDAMTEKERAELKRHRATLERQRVQGNTQRNAILEQRLDRQIKNARAVLGRTRTTRNGERLMPLLPFRLYLLRQLRQGFSVRGIAETTKHDEALIRRWVDGIYWEGECNPQPIHSISLGIVDEILVNMGESPDKLNELYPWEDE